MKTISELRIAEHEAAHAIAALELGITLICVSIEPSVSALDGRPISAFCDHSLSPIQGESLKDTLKRKAVFAYVASAAEAAIYGESAIAVIEEQQDDMARVTQCVELLRSEGVPEEEIREWRGSAWQSAQDMARDKKSEIQNVARSLISERKLSGDAVREIIRKI